MPVQSGPESFPPRTIYSVKSCPNSEPHIEHDWVQDHGDYHSTVWHCPGRAVSPESSAPTTAAEGAGR